MADQPLGLSPDNRIMVVPVEGGWSLRTALSDAPLMFLSGAKAEAEAKALAARIAAAGQDTRVLIHDRSEALVATFRYFGTWSQVE